MLAWDADSGGSMHRLAGACAGGVPVELGPPGPKPWPGMPPSSAAPGSRLRIRCWRRPGRPGLAVIDELELGWRLIRAPVIAVTGTNGKSTSCGLIAAMLVPPGCARLSPGTQTSGRRLSAAAGGDADVVVCEVSSYQLEAVDRMLPEIALLTNLTPEHLGRHRTMGRYEEIKTRLFIRGADIVGRAVLNVDDPLGRRVAGLVRAGGGTAIGVGADPAADYQLRGVRWGLRTPISPCALRRNRVLSSPLPGAHNARNVLTAFAVAELAGVPRADAIAALAAAGTRGPL